MFKNKGHILCHLACFTLGFTALFAKAISWPIVSIIFYRSLIASISLLIFLWVTDKLPHLKKKDILLHSLLGSLLALHWVTYFYSVYLTSVAIGLISLFTFPVITSLIEPFFEKQVPKIKDILISLCLIPGLILMNSSSGLSIDSFFGIGIGIFSAIVYSFRNILSKRLTQSHSGVSLMMIQSLIAAIVLAPFALRIPISLTQHNVQLIILLGILFTAVGHTLFISSFKYISAKSASIIASGQPLYGTIWAFIFLKEVPSINILLGGSVILGLVIYETIETKS
jgi:drug/metabolite transporter (DMT)-like permease